MAENPRIVFMGTPDFAVPSLELLISRGYNLVAVITSQDKPSGRGQKISSSAVKHCAEKHGIPVLQPVDLKDPAFITQLNKFKPDLQVVVAFRMLPRVVWSIPPLGTFNLHASLLPQYRGAAPINWAIIHGDVETGLTTFFIDDKIDTGQIIIQRKIPITQEETAGYLHDKMMHAGAELTCDTVEMIIDGSFKLIDQKLLAAQFRQIRPAPKIFKEDCRINWSAPAKNIFNFIRGLSPYPLAWDELAKGKSRILTKIYSADIISDISHEDPGKIITDNKTFFHVSTSDRLIQIDEIQIEGKKRLSVTDFLRGFDLTGYSFGQMYESS